MSRNLALFEAPEPSPEHDDVSAHEYRRRILKLRRAEERRAALAEIRDPNTRAVVMFYVRDHFARRQHHPLPCLSCIQREVGATAMIFPCKHKQS